MGNIQKGVSSPHHDMHPAHQHPDSFFLFFIFYFLNFGVENIIFIHCKGSPRDVPI